MSILTFRKSEKEDVRFRVSRLVEAIWLQSNGSAEIVVEGMITADEKTNSFDSFEILIPMNVSEAYDVTESFLNEDLFENKARNSYKLINEAEKRIVLSNIPCEVVYPLGVDLLHNHEYSEVHVTFPKAIQKSEVRPFRIILKVPKLANKTRTYYHGIVTYEFSISLYDISQVEHSRQLRRQLESQKDRLVECERVYLWAVSPEDVEVVRVSPSPIQIVDYNRKGPLSEDVGKTRKAIYWEPKTLTAFPWSKMRFTGTLRKQSILSITTIIAIAGFAVGVIGLMLHFLSR